MNARRYAIVVLGLGLGALIVMVLSRSPEAPRSVPSPELPTLPEIAPSTLPPPSPPSPPSAHEAPHAADRQNARSSPHRTVATQLALLEKGSDADFRATFLPSVQPELTSETIARCREHMRGRPVKPHWAMAEESVEGGKRVVRVSMFGKSLTGFHESAPDQWLADHVWCLPTVP